MTGWLRRGLAILVGVALLWLYPPLRVISLREARTAGQAASFDAATFARDFWEGPLPKALGDSVAGARLVALLRENPQQARDDLGHTPAFSRSCFFTLQGGGTVVEVASDRILVSLMPPAAAADVALLTGPLFGNTVRDATGLLAAGDFANSQHFNEISAELNALVESRVMAPLRQEAAPGRQLTFTGCAEVGPATDVAVILEVVPVSCAFDSPDSGSGAAP